MARSMVRFSTSLLSPAKDPAQLRYNAARLLGEMWVKEAVVPLRKVLREGGSRRVARAVLLALGRIGDRSALPDLLEAAQSDDFFIQIRAVGALGEMGEARAEPLLLSEHADANIHHAAAQALAKVVTAVAIPVLEQQLQAEPLESVIERITEALDVIRQKAR